MRIGEPARRHGVADVDIWHAARTALRRVDMGDNLTVLIGPAPDGALLEMGVLDLEGDDPGRHPRHAAETEVLPVPQVRGDQCAVHKR